MNEIEQLTAAVLKLTRAVHGLQKDIEGRFRDLDERIRSTERMMPGPTLKDYGASIQIDPGMIQWQKMPWPDGSKVPMG